MQWGYTSLVRNRNSHNSPISKNQNELQCRTSLTTNPDSFARLLQYQSNYIKRLFNEVVETNPSNSHIINDYIIAEEAETNIQESTKSDKIKKLCLLSRFFHHQNMLL